MCRSVNCLCVHSFFVTQPKKSCCNFFLHDHINWFYSSSVSIILIQNQNLLFYYVVIKIGTNSLQNLLKSTVKFLVNVGISASEVLGVGSWVFSVWGLGLNPKPKTKQLPSLWDGRWREVEHTHLDKTWVEYRDSHKTTTWDKDKQRYYYDEIRDKDKEVTR